MADPPPAPPPTLAEATSWVGFDVDEAGGARVGRAYSVFVDADSGEPSWLIAIVGRRRWGRGRTKSVAIPIRDCAGAAGRVWTAHGRHALRAAHSVDPTRSLLREHELTICSHYGIGERAGRAAEVAGRPEGSVTSKPA